MGWLRRFPVSTASLVVYLVACLAGTGLHHHGHGECRAKARGDCTQPLSITSAPASCDDDGDGCAVCSALHLARAPVALARVVVVHEATGEAGPTVLLQWV